MTFDFLRPTLQKTRIKLTTGSEQNIEHVVLRLSHTRWKDGNKEIYDPISCKRALLIQNTCHVSETIMPRNFYSRTTGGTQVHYCLVTCRTGQNFKPRKPETQFSQHLVSGVDFSHLFQFCRACGHCQLYKRLINLKWFCHQDEWLTCEIWEHLCGEGNESIPSWKVQQTVYRLHVIFIIKLEWK